MGVAHTIPKLPFPPSIPKLKLSTPKLPLRPPSIPKLSKKKPSTPKRPKKPFRQIVPESFSGTRPSRASPNKMNQAVEAYDTDITDAASVTIGSDLPVEEREFTER